MYLSGRKIPGPRIVKRKIKKNKKISSSPKEKTLGKKENGKDMLINFQARKQSHQDLTVNFSKYLLNHSPSHINTITIRNNSQNCPLP